MICDPYEQFLTKTDNSWMHSRWKAIQFYPPGSNQGTTNKMSACHLSIPTQKIWKITIIVSHRLYQGRASLKYISFDRWIIMALKSNPLFEWNSPRLHVIGSFVQLTRYVLAI